MGTGCGAYGGRNMRTGFLLRHPNERNYLEDLGVEGNIT
jgi:hypothetical protein